MLVCLCQRVLQQVGAGLASLSKPTTDGVEQIANSFAAIRLECTDMEAEEVKSVVGDVEQYARGILFDKPKAHAACVEALHRAGLMALLRLVKHAEQPANTMAETRLSLDRKVLVVDDSRVSAVALSNALVAKDFLVRSVATMEEALAEFRLFCPTVVISDVHMPDLDVTVLCRTFRELSRGRPTLTVLVSGTTGPELEARLDEIRPDAFVPKMTGTAPVVRRVLALWDALHAKTSK